MKKNLIILLAAFLILPVIVVKAQIRKGNGNIAIEKRKVDKFTTVVVRHSINLFITQGDKVELKIEADENLHEVITTEVEDGILDIYADNIIRKAKKLNVYLTVKNIESIEANSGSTVKSESKISFDNLELIATSGSKISINLNTNNLYCSISSGAKVKLLGKANVFEFDASSGSKLEALELEVEDCIANTSSGADAWVNSNKNLEITASGGSDLYYKGNPKIKNIECSGKATIKETD